MEIYPILKTHRRKTFPHLQSRLRGGVARRPGQCPHGGLEQREGDGVVATDGEEGGVGVDQGRRECDHIAVALWREACGRDMRGWGGWRNVVRKVVKEYRHGERGWAATAASNSNAKYS